MLDVCLLAAFNRSAAPRTAEPTGAIEVHLPGVAAGEPERTEGIGQRTCVRPIDPPWERRQGEVPQLVVDITCWAA